MTCPGSSSATTARTARLMPWSKAPTQPRSSDRAIGQDRQRSGYHNTLWNQPESAGLNAIAEGFRHLGLEDDRAMLAAQSIVYDALFAYCREMVRRGRLDGLFR